LNYTGGLVLDTLVRHLPQDTLSIATVLNPAIRDAVVTPDLKVPTTVFAKPRENGALFLRAMFPRATSFLFESYAHWVVVPRLAKKISRLCKEQGITDIWCVLQGQTMARLANQIAARTGLPLYTQVWDSVGWWLRANRVDGFWSRRIHAQYDNAIRRSSGFAAASLPMAAEYAKTYGVRAVPVMHSLPATWAVTDKTKRERKPGCVRIALSGQIYARTEFDALISSLENIDWKIDGRNVEVHVFGRHFEISASKPSHIVFRGWCSQEDLIRELSGFDILYCPYWFDPAFEEEAKSSFPSKVTTYFTSARPVLFHGPKYSSVAKLFADRGCGVACTSLNPQEIVASIRTLLDDAKSADIIRNANQVFFDLFTIEAQEKAFKKFLGISVDGALARD
jgi:hypothetical protein